jgi:uncharacterized membrane protein YkoI
MKTLSIALFLNLLLMSYVSAQESASIQVPPAVSNAVKAKFADATELKWEEKAGGYKAEFKIGTRKHEAWLDKAGAIKKHKQDFPKKELPEAIRKKIESEFAAYKIDDADKTEENGSIVYEVDLKGADERKLVFTSDGVLKENKAKSKNKE